MVSAKTLRRVVLGMGLLVVIWAAPAGAVDEPVAKPAPTTEPDGAGLMAFYDRFKAAVDAVKLSDDAQKKADAMFEAAHKDLKALEEISDRDEAKKKARAIFDKLRVDISTLLSEDQKQEIQKKLQGVGIATTLLIEKIKQQLSKPELKLTDEQKKQVDDVLDDTKRRLEELRAEAQGGGKDVRGKLRDILQDMKEKLTKILSPDQLKGFTGGGAKPGTAPKSSADSK